MSALGVRPRAEHAWAAFLVLGVAAVVLYLFVPPFAGSGPFLNVIGLGGVVAIAVGLRRNRPATPLPWALFVLGVGLFWLGDLYTYSYPKLLGREVPFPSLGDGIYLLMYPVLMAGLLLLVRRRNPRRDLGGVLDSMIITLGLSLPSWVLLIAPYLHDETLSALPKLVSVAYPLGDVLLLAAAVRLAMDGGRRQPAFHLLSAGIAALLVTDFVYGVLTLHGTYDHQLSLDVGWTAFYLCWGAAALHPSMRELEEPSPATETKLTRPRLALLAGASLIAPAIQAVQEAQRGNVDLLVIIGASVILFAFVVARMAGLVREQERSVARERVLSAAGAALVAATDRDEIGRAALDSVRPLLNGVGDGLLCVLEGPSLRVTGRSDQPAAIPDATLSLPTTAEVRHIAGSGRRGGTVLSDAACDELGLALGTRAIALELLIRGETRGVLLVARAVETPPLVEDALRALATQVALALESASLTEEVYARRSAARFASLVQHSSDLITVLAADTTIVYQSPSVERTLGYTPEDLVGTRFDRLLASGEEGRLLHVLADGTSYAGAPSEALECTMTHKDGSVRQFEVLHTNLLDDPHVRGIVLNARDISERKAFEEQLSHQAFHDAVTGLPNRALFVERARHAIARSRRETGGLAVIFLDLDDFKTINDSLGHAVGDEVLLTVAKRLATCVRSSDTVARFGGDEFAVLLEDVSGAEEAADTAERLIEVIGQPLSLGGKEFTVRSSLGIAMIEDGRPATAEDLIRDADAAMYIAKRDGKGGYRLFEPEMHAGVLARLELRADLQRALIDGELELHYQPVVRLSDGVVAGVEALLRWRHPERGLVPPDQFIGFAEETGLIVPIGRWVLNEACRVGVAMQHSSPTGEPLSMSVNLSVKQLQHSDVVADVRDALEESGLPPSQLMLEITETVLVVDTELCVERLEELRALGIRLAMDDFGTGYSSLSYLSRLPVDVLKMDRSFLSDGATPEMSSLTSAVVALGETLSLEVVAEGIEYGEQWTTLRDLGCELGQGFYFARPMESPRLMEFLRAPDVVRPAAARDVP